MKLNTITNAITGLIADLESRLVPFGEIYNCKFPCYILHSGDESFVNKKYDFMKNQTQISQSIPRFVLSPQDLSVEMNEIASPSATGMYIDHMTDDIKIQRKGPLNIVPVVVSFNSQIVFTDILQAWAFVEYAFDCLWPQATFTFLTHGKENIGVYTWGDSFSPQKKTEFQFSPERDHVTLDIPFQLQFHLVSTGYFKLVGGVYNNSGSDSTDVDISKVLHNTKITTGENSPVYDIATLEIPKT